MNTRNEKEIKAEDLLKKHVQMRKGLCFKLKFIGIAGAPDRILLMPGGRLFFVELKRAVGGALEPSQKIVFAMLERLGFIVHVLCGSAEVEQFAKDYL